MKRMLAALLIVLVPAMDVIALDGDKAKEIKNGSLESNETLLNQWGPQPQAVRDLYRAAYNVLAADPDASHASLAGDAGVRKIGVKYGIVHLGGPMLGQVTSSGASVWIRTLAPARVEVRVMIDGEEKPFGPVASSAATDMTAVVDVTGLAPSRSYPYRVLVDGKEIPIYAHAAITTAPNDKKATTVRIAFGTCFHRWGLGNQQQADRIRSRKPSALLVYGDIAVQDRKNHLGLHRADYLLRDFMPAWRSLVASVPVFANWDDHDYFRNDGAGVPKGFTDADRRNVRSVFCRAWNNPAYGFGDQQGGVFLRTRVGPCDVIMTDNRYFRSGKKGSFLGEAQLKWLETQLLDCKGPFIIVSCGTMWSDYVSKGKDSWGKWDPEGRERIFRLIEKNRIAGVLLISGDRHGARGFQIPRPSGFTFYEFEAASMGGRTGPPVRRAEPPIQFYGTAGEYAFGEFSIDATVDDPTVTFRLIRVADGEAICQKKLTRSQLTPPGK